MVVLPSAASRFVTKSGTTSFRGDLGENFPNSAFDAIDANTWTRNHATLCSRPQPFRFNQFGVDFNGQPERAGWPKAT
jgi:hypothetical protein